MKLEKGSIVLEGKREMKKLIGISQVEICLILYELYVRLALMLTQI